MQVTRMSTVSKVVLGFMVGGVLVAAVQMHRDRLQLGIARSEVAAAGTGGGGAVAARKAGQVIVAVDQWPGFMPLVLANGGLTTQPGSTAAAEGLDLRIDFIEDAPKKNKALQDGTVDAVWETVDELPITLGAYRDARVEVRTFLQLDWSRGGDACVASADVKNVDDVVGHKLATLMFSPDHTLLEFMLLNSRLSKLQAAQVRRDTTFSRDDPTQARKLFAERKVDVACMWEPDVTLALESRPGSHRLFSTAEATDLVADILIARRDFLDSKPAVAERLARVWLAGARKAEADRPAAARFVSTVVPRFRDELGYEGTLKSFGWVKWADLSDNASFFGLDGEDPAFDRVYNHADGIWMGYPQAEIRDRFAPVTLREDRIIRRLWDSAGSKLPPRREKYEELVAQTGAPLFTKHVSIGFRSATAELDTDSMSTLNRQVLPQLEIARGMSIRIEGNTDSVGPETINQRLSEARAQAIAEYLITRGVDRNRIVARGNGSARPIASNRTADGRAQNRRTDVLFIPARHSVM
jgi:NitT/TauT family transport system substrate-binding protein